MINDINLKTSLGRFRMVALLEGISYIVLLTIAMPLKYMMGMPMPVKIVGWLHGALFVYYMFCLLQVFIDRRWPVSKAALAFVVSLIPFATFWFDGRLRKEERENTAL